MSQQQVPLQEPKPNKKPKATFALKPEHFQNKNGLKKLYQLTNAVNWNEPVPIEVAMNLVTVSLKTWHYQMLPKYSFDYFLQRCQALGNHKLTGYMNKVRRIHKGRQDWQTQKAEEIPNSPVLQVFQEKIKMISQDQVPEKQQKEMMEDEDEDFKLFEQMQAMKKQRKKSQSGIQINMEEPFSYDYDD